MGSSRVLVAIYFVLFLAATGRSTVQIVRDFDLAPFAYSLSAVAAAVYLLAGIAIAMAHRNVTWRRIAWCAVAFEYGGVLCVGLLSQLDPALFPAASVWSDFGQGYLYIPLVLPLCGFSYLETSRRRSMMRTSAEVAA